MSGTGFRMRIHHWTTKISCELWIASHSPYILHNIIGRTTPHQFHQHQLFCYFRCLANSYNNKNNNTSPRISFGNSICCWLFVHLHLYMFYTISFFRFLYYNCWYMSILNSYSHRLIVVLLLQLASLRFLFGAVDVASLSILFLLFFVVVHIPILNSSMVCFIFIHLALILKANAGSSGLLLSSAYFTWIFRFYSLCIIQDIVQETCIAVTSPIALAKKAISHEMSNTTDDIDDHIQQ